MAGKKDAFYSQVRQLSVLTTIPLILLLGPLIGFFAGSWIDNKARMTPWFTILFVGLGFAASGREVARLLKQILKEDNRK